jgi:hypothetical protein
MCCGGRDQELSNANRYSLNVWSSLFLKSWTEVGLLNTIITFNYRGGNKATKKGFWTKDEQI